METTEDKERARRVNHVYIWYVEQRVVDVVMSGEGRLR